MHTDLTTCCDRCGINSQILHVDNKNS